MPSRPTIALNAAPTPTSCLDFANTLTWRGTAAPVEGLVSFTALVDWISKFAGVPAADLETIRRWAGGHQMEADALLHACVALREMVYRVFHAVASGAPVAEADLTALNRALAEAPPRTRLARLSGVHAWRVDIAALSAAGLLSPILWSAADLLVQARYHRIRHCANPACMWLFVDESKNGTRRWCDMTACGNRAKARRHYLRSRDG
jgi:predicted RNA-binding Zn ribbon-like protein